MHFRPNHKHIDKFVSRPAPRLEYHNLDDLRLRNLEWQKVSPKFQWHHRLPIDEVIIPGLAQVMWVRRRTPMRKKGFGICVWVRPSNTCHHVLPWAPLFNWSKAWLYWNRSQYCTSLIDCYQGQNELPLSFPLLHFIALPMCASTPMHPMQLTTDCVFSWL